MAIILALFTIFILYFSCCHRQTWKNQPVCPDTIVTDANIDQAQYRLFFIRHIDTIYNDTLYSVCYLSPEGDTIRAKLPLQSDPDTTIWVNYYLRNNGDTIIIENHSELFLDSLPVEHSNLFQNRPEMTINESLADSISNKERAVIEEVEQYVKNFQLVRTAKKHSGL